MSEFLRWGDSAAPGRIVEPLPGLKEAGYAVNEVPLSENFNWLLREFSRGALPRFDTAAEFVQSEQTRGMIEPHPDAETMAFLGEVQQSPDSLDTTDVLNVISTARRCYVMRLSTGADGRIVELDRDSLEIIRTAYAPDDGVLVKCNISFAYDLLWTVVTGYLGSGQYQLVGIDPLTLDVVVANDIDTGKVFFTAADGQYMYLIANGDHIAIATIHTTDVTELYLFSYDGATITPEGSFEILEKRTIYDIDMSSRMLGIACDRRDPGVLDFSAYLFEYREEKLLNPHNIETAGEDGVAIAIWHSQVVLTTTTQLQLHAGFDTVGDPNLFELVWTYSTPDRPVWISPHSLASVGRSNRYQSISSANGEVLLKSSPIVGFNTVGGIKPFFDGQDLFVCQADPSTGNYSVARIAVSTAPLIVTRRDSAIPSDYRGYLIPAGG